MMKNERQYRITKAQVEKFERALAQMRENPSDQASVDPVLQEAMTDALRSQLADLRQEIEEYEALRSGRYQVFALASSAELPRALIQSGMPPGLTRKELASRLGLKQQSRHCRKAFLLVAKKALGVSRGDELAPRTSRNLLLRGETMARC